MGHQDSGRRLIRDEIEQIVKARKIDREKFHEVSKLRYESIINKFYYSFCDYEKFPVQDLNYLYLRFHKRLHWQNMIYCSNWESYINQIDIMIPAKESKNVFYFLLNYGWVYEGHLTEIKCILNEINGLMEDFYIISKDFEWTVAHSDDGDCMWLITY